MPCVVFFTGYGQQVLGSGGWAGDGMGGGTGLTGGENTGTGFLSLTQATTAIWLTAYGTSTLSHEISGQFCNAFGVDAGKWTTGCNAVIFVGTNTGKFVLNPLNQTIVGNNSAWGGQFTASVTGAVNNGSGLCRLTTTTTGMVTGDTAVVTNITGTGGVTACNGVFTNVTIVDGTHMDLTGSTFAGTYVSGGNIEDYGDVSGAGSITIVGYNTLASTAWRPTSSNGRISWLGALSLNSATNVVDIAGIGSSSLINATTAGQTTASGNGSGNTITSAWGNTLYGFQTDVVSNSTYNAVAIGASGNGGAKGAIASDQGITIGGNGAGSYNLGPNTIIISPQGGHSVCSGGSNVLIINTAAADCAAANEVGTGHIGTDGNDIMHWAGGANAATLLDTRGPIMVKGTKFTASGCSNSTLVGGASRGTVTSGTTGTCTIVITIAGATGLTAPNGWVCNAQDITTPANAIKQSASSSTTCTITGTTASGDVIAFDAEPF